MPLPYPIPPTPENTVDTLFCLTTQFGGEERESKKSAERFGFFWRIFFFCEISFFAVALQGCTTFGFVLTFFDKKFGVS